MAEQHSALSADALGRAQSNTARGVAARRPYAAASSAGAGGGRCLLAAATLAVGAMACELGTAPPLEVSYLAIVSLIERHPDISPGAQYRYHVRELSGTFGIDTTITVAPTDTVILRLPGATYAVALDGLPASCRSRYPLQQYVSVADGGFTSLARYYIGCQAPLTIRTRTEGVQPDPDIVYRLIGPDGAERLGIAAANDTLTFDGIAPGRYQLQLSLIAANCTVTSAGGARPSVTVDPAGGTVLDVRITCSDELRRPRLVAFQASYHDGASAFYLRVTDPDRDIERYVWNLTDCRGTSVLPGGERLRRGLSSGRTRGQDTITVVAAFEVGVAAADLRGRCTSIRVADELGNSTPVVETPIGPDAGAAPVAALFNARLIDTTGLRTQLAVADPDGDYAGVFVAARLRDGVLSAPDGQPDIGVYGVAGYLDAQVPDLPLGSRIRYNDVYAVIAYLIDARGAFTRLEDTDVFR